MTDLYSKSNTATATTPPTMSLARYGIVSIGAAKFYPSVPEDRVVSPCLTSAPVGTSYVSVHSSHRSSRGDGRAHAADMNSEAALTVRVLPFLSKIATGPPPPSPVGS